MKKTFTESDIEFIKKHYKTKGAAFIVDALDSRYSYSSIKQKANKMGLKRHTKFRMSKEQTDFIRAHVHLSNLEIANRLNVPEKKIQAYCWNYKLREKCFEYYTQKEVDFLCEHYTTMSYAEMAKVLGRTVNSVHAKIKLLGLKRTKKQSKAIMNRATSATRFKPGNLPQTTKYDGAISERTDSSGITYKHIRISKANWQMLHVYNWEKKHGSVQKGMILRCLDGDQLNCDPDNWELVDRAEHLEKNSGRKTLEDRYIISKIAHRQPELKEQIANFPELIEMKRQQIKLRRTIDECNDKA